MFMVEKNCLFRNKKFFKYDFKNGLSLPKVSLFFFSCGSLISGPGFWNILSDEGKPLKSIGKFLVEFFRGIY